MAGSDDKADGHALWREWRTLAGGGLAGAAAPDALLLAAYAEGRLAGTAAEAVEDWLADHPEAIDDVLAARAAAARADDAAPAAVLDRAMGLVAAAEGTVVPFRRPSRPAPAPFWRIAAAWGGIAASIVATSLVGFELGSDAYASLSASASSASSFDLLDPPGGLFTSFGEDLST